MQKSDHYLRHLRNNHMISLWQNHEFFVSCKQFFRTKSLLLLFIPFEIRSSNIKPPNPQTRIPYLTYNQYTYHKPMSFAYLLCAIIHRVYHCTILQFSTCSTGIASKTFWLLSQTHFSAVARHPKIEFIFFARPKNKGNIITKCWYNHQVRHQGITIRSDTWV